MSHPPDPYKFGEAYHEEAVARRYGGRHRSLRGRIAHARECRLLARLLGRATGDGRPLVLDAPSGAGRFATKLQALGYDVVALDAAPPMVAQAREWTARAVVGSASDLPLADGSVAAAICVRLLHHLPEASDRVRVLRELARVARGPIVATVWLDALYVRYRRARHRRPGSRHLITSEQLAADLADAGLALKQSVRQIPLTSPLVWMRLERAV